MLQRTLFCCEPPYYLIQSPRYCQVLTEILPYDGSDKANVIADIASRKRPPYPTDPSQNQWLQDPVWDTITACWSHKPELRPKLSVVYRVFLRYGRQEARDVELGNLTTHYNRDFTIADSSHIKIVKQQRARFLPRIVSLFQFLPGLEPEIERSVSGMDKAGHFPFPLSIRRLTKAVASRGQHYIESGTTEVAQ